MSHNYKKIIYDKYYSVHTKNLYGNFSNESVKKQYKFWNYYFSEYLPKDFTIQILDAGCGNGGFVSWLIDCGYKNSKGVDISKEMIDLGKSLNIDNLYQEDLFEYLRKNKNVFDIIFCRDVLEHFKKNEIIEIFSLFYDSLKSSGKIIIQVQMGLAKIMEKYSTVILHTKLSSVRLS